MRTLLSLPRDPSFPSDPVEPSPGASGAPSRGERLLDGKYRVERVLGHGGSGLVVAATHVQLDQRVAIKSMLRTGLQYPNALERFAREARAAARIKSDHVVRIYDVGEDDEGLPYIVMEYLEGYDLWRTLEDRGALPVQEALGYAAQICEALCQAHSVGIVHRDLKPANVFLARRAGRSLTVKVLDFGMSKCNWGFHERPITEPRLVMGTPGWMSPEQLRSTHDVDARSDVWCFGALLYNMLVGKAPSEIEPPKRGPRPEAALDPPSRYRLGIPPGLDAVVLKCLSTNPGDRFQTATELALALAASSPPGPREVAERPCVSFPGGTSREVPPSRDYHVIVRDSVGSTRARSFARRTTVAATLPGRRIALVVAASSLVALLGITWSRTLRTSTSDAAIVEGPAEGESFAESTRYTATAPAPALAVDAPDPSESPEAARSRHPPVPVKPPRRPDDADRVLVTTRSAAPAATSSRGASPPPPSRNLLHPEFGERN